MMNLHLAHHTVEAISAAGLAAALGLLSLITAATLLYVWLIA